MKTEILIHKIWNDDDITEFKISVCNGHSIFSNKVYTAVNEVGDLVKSLSVFRDHLYGGLRNIDFGNFGREYANGAFSARLHFPKPSTLYISTHQQSEKLTWPPKIVGEIIDSKLSFIYPS